MNGALGVNVSVVRHGLLVVVKVMNKEKTIFDYLNNIYYKKGIVYDKKVAPAYLISMWLSHDNKLNDIVNTINEFQFFLPDNLIYQYYYYKVPSGNRFLKWVKKEETDKKIKEKFDTIRKEMCLSKIEMSKFMGFVNVLENNTTKTKKKTKNASSLFL